MDDDAPQTSRFVPFHLPDIGEAEIESVVSALRSGWLTTGPKVKEFENAFARYVGARHAVAVNSCTAALHLALEAIGIREGDEVILPTMTFAATAEVVTYFGARPVLVDIRPDTLNLDVSKVAQAITPKTKAIIPVHFAGQPCDMEDILELSHSHNVKIIEDAAHALPARYRERMIGTLGDITCFSFYATKTITTGEGGMVTTENAEWASRIRMMSLHGMTRDAWSRYGVEGSWAYDIVSPGYKYNLTDIAAALGLPQLQHCQSFWETRQRYALLYHKAFQDLPEVVMPHTADDVQHAWHLYVIQLDLDRLRIDRNQFVDLLKKNNIGCSVHFIPIHLHSYYRQTFGYRPEQFPVASAAFERIVSLPLYSKMTLADIEHVSEVVRNIICEYRR